VSIQTELPPPPLAFLRGAGAGVGVRARPGRRILSWLVGRHHVAAEILVLVGVYVIYDAARGVVAGGASVAVRHAREVATLERHLHLFVEPAVQRVLAHLPGLHVVFDVGYDACHLGVTGGVLVWLYLRRADVYARVRTTLLAATALALVGFTVFPTAPPRLAGLGVADSLHLAAETDHSGLLQLLYNPYAAMPSLHMAFAVIAGGSLMAFGGRRCTRIIGAVYIAFVAVEVVATGNHFVLDVATGIGIDALAAAWAFHLRPGRRRTGPVPAGPALAGPALAGPVRPTTRRS
jgi:hypothetical protein